VETAYEVSIRVNIHALVSELNQNLGSPVVQAITGTKDRGMPAQWGRPDGPEPRQQVTARLRLGYRVWKLLCDAEGKDVALAWMVGSNPRLNEQTPVTVIRELNAAQVIGAAEAFINGPVAA